jgi:hypothetical protein
MWSFELPYANSINDYVFYPRSKLVNLSLYVDQKKFVFLVYDLDGIGKTVDY